MRDVLFKLLVYVAFMGFGFVFGHTFGSASGHSSGFSAGAKRFENSCSCGAVRTCPFGPGVVGQQVCQTTSLKNKWSRCEPYVDRN